MLKSLYNEPITSSQTFDKTAKKIIRTHYKVIFDKQQESVQSNSSEKNENASNLESPSIEELKAIVAKLTSDNKQLKFQLVDKDKKIKALTLEMDKNVNQNNELRETIIAQNETLKEKTDILSRDKADLDEEIIKL